jgi:H+/Cl- antiporter ClcA
MNAEFQAAVQAVLGYFLVPFMQKLKSWLKIDDPLAKGIAVVLIVGIVSLAMNFINGYGWNWQMLLQNIGAMTITALIGNANRKRIEKTNGGTSK